MSFSRKDWPEIGDLVIASVDRIESYGAYVNLDEYKGKEGLLHISEISSRWVRNIRNHVRQGQKVVLQVLRVDSNKEQIDLSLRRVSKDERRKKIEHWKKTRKAETLFTQAAATLNMDVKHLYETEGIKIIEFYQDLYEGLEAAAKKGKKALKDAGLSDEIAKLLSDIAKDKILIKGVTIQGIMEITTMSERGVEEIKETFQATQQIGIENDAEVNIYSMGAPKYRVEVTAEDYKKAEAALDKIVSYSQELWGSHEGTISFSRD